MPSSASSVFSAAVSVPDAAWTSPRPALSRALGSATTTQLAAAGSSPAGRARRLSLPGLAIRSPKKRLRIVAGPSGAPPLAPVRALDAVQPAQDAGKIFGGLPVIDVDLEVLRARGRSFADAPG